MVNLFKRWSNLLFNSASHVPFSCNFGGWGRRSLESLFSSAAFRVGGFFLSSHRRGSGSFEGLVSVILFFIFMRDLLDAGFATLGRLKDLVLPKVMRDSYDVEGEWDEDLRMIGRLVVGSFNRYCNRVFQWNEAAVYSEAGGMSTISLDRYPVGEVTALELRGRHGDYDKTSAIYLVKEQAGLLELCYRLGCPRDMVKVNFSGGFWLAGARRESCRESARALVPVNETQVEVLVPDGFTSADWYEVSVRRVFGQGQLGVDAVDVSGVNPVVTLDSGPVAGGQFEVVLMFARLSRKLVPAHVTEVALVPPAGYDAVDATIVKLRSVGSFGDAEVVNFEVRNGEVLALLDAPIAEDGGFEVLAFFEEPEEVMPEGATPLPDDLFGAYVMQCQAVMEHLNTIWSQGVQRSQERVGQLGGLQLVPMVRQILNTYKRYR